MPAPSTILVSRRPSPALLRAAAGFAMTVRRADRAMPAWVGPAARRLDRALRPGEVALITGPSGSGKTLLARALVRRLRLAGRPVRVPAPATAATGALIDRLRGPLGRRLRDLCRAGLGDATLLGRRAGELSAGEAWRLTLARSMRARPRETIVLDEFASVLDRLAAYGVSRSVARWARAGRAPSRDRARVVCATAHDDVIAWLEPDVLVVCRPGHGPILTRRGAAALEVHA